MTTNPPISVRNDTATTPTPTPATLTTAATVVCGFCGTWFVPVGRQQWCSDRCRQAVWRRRNHVPRPIPLPPKAQTVYECPKCATRYLGEQYCPDCFTFCRNIGPGGPCPHCDDIVAVGDLADIGGRS